MRRSSRGIPPQDAEARCLRITANNMIMNTPKLKRTTTNEPGGKKQDRVVLLAFVDANGHDAPSTFTLVTESKFEPVKVIGGPPDVSQK